MTNSHSPSSAATEQPRGMEPILSSLMMATLDHATTSRPALRAKFEEILRGQLRDPAQSSQVRAAAIEECAALMRRWRDEAAEFNDDRCRQQANLCQNASVAISNLAAQPPAAPVETKPDWCQGADAICHHPACVCVLPHEQCSAATSDDIELLKADIRDSRAINDTLREEIERLKHDLDRHIQIATDLANEPQNAQVMETER